MKLFNTLLVLFMPLVPKFIVRFFADRYIAGPDLDDAVKLTEYLNTKGICATMDVLGESVENWEQVEQEVRNYKDVLDAIAEHSLDSNVSIKPTAFGLAMDYDRAKGYIAEIVAYAKSKDNFVRLDMENVPYTDDTLRMYREFREEFGERYVGTVIQSYLRRTPDDALKLAEENANLRLCKGIYVEDRKYAYKDMACINRNFAEIMEILMGDGCYVGIATHDEKLVQEGLRVARKLGLRRDQFEFQMLLGVDQELRDIIAESGYRMRVYVPFGMHWYAYSTRRLRENPDMAVQTFKAIFKPYKKFG
ncbi:MAG: proline dehydrogenase [bacterium]|nr:proline dehydrogenase [bacterium]